MLFDFLFGDEHENGSESDYSWRKGRREGEDFDVFARDYETEAEYETELEDALEDYNEW